MKRWIAVAVLVAALFRESAAVEVTSTTLQVQPGPPCWVWNPAGSNYVPCKGDGSGVQYFTDAYAPAIGSLTVVSAVSLGSTECNYSNPRTAALNTGGNSVPYDANHAEKWARIVVTGAPTNGPPWSVRFYGSMDGITYAPLLKTKALVTEWMGMTALDTLKVRGRSADAGSWFPLIAENRPVMHPFVIAVCSADSTIAAADYVVTVQIGSIGK